MAGAIRKRPLRHPRHAQRTTGHALGHAAQDVRLAGGVKDLHELAAAAPGDLPAIVREGLPIIMQALPEAWATALRSVAPPSQWPVSQDAADVRIWSRAPNGSLGASHVVSPTGALLPAPPGAAARVLPDGLQRALVMPWAPGRPWHPRSRAAAATPPPLFCFWVLQDKVRASFFI